MVKNHFNLEQKKIIRRICRIQIKSYIECLDMKDYQGELLELQEADYNVKGSDFERFFILAINKYIKAKKFPNNLYLLLDKDEIGQIKHVLLNYFKNQKDPQVRGIWKKLFLSDYVVGNQDRSIGNGSIGKNFINFNLNNN